MPETTLFCAECEQTEHAVWDEEFSVWSFDCGNVVEDGDVPNHPMAEVNEQIRHICTA